MATLYRCRTPTDWLCPCGRVARELRRRDVAFTEVRVERLQSITEDDAIAEGMQAGFEQQRAAFALKWDAINGDRASWAANPWVWVVGFKRVQP